MNRGWQRRAIDALMRLSDAEARDCRIAPDLPAEPPTPPTAADIDRRLELEATLWADGLPAAVKMLVDLAMAGDMTDHVLADLRSLGALGDAVLRAIELELKVRFLRARHRRLALPKAAVIPFPRRSSPPRRNQREEKSGGRGADPPHERAGRLLRKSQPPNARFQNILNTAAITAAGRACNPIFRARA